MQTARDPRAVIVCFMEFFLCIFTCQKGRLRHPEIFLPLATSVLYPLLPAGRTHDHCISKLLLFLPEHLDPHLDIDGLSHQAYFQHRIFLMAVNPFDSALIAL